MARFGHGPRHGIADRPVRDTRGYRTELHGVRGLAIALVVAFHIFGQGRVSGGIDIFLAITGFLAIPSLARRARAGHGGWLMDIPARLAGLARRLIIPLAPVLIAVGLISWLVLPLTRREQTLTEVAASALFFENWELINSQLSYDAAGPLTSPLQHLWSTSIQGQFHLVMIALVTLLAAGARRYRISLRALLLGTLTFLTALSLGYAIIDTGHQQAAAYFSTFSRTWQLTGPGILGLIIADIRLTSRTRVIMSWLGVALIGTCGAVLNGAEHFPGPLALWPITGICLVLLAGDTRSRWGADRLLATWPFQRLGDISYSLYLWHWPILILAMAWAGSGRVTPLIAGITLGLSLAFGFAGYRLFETALPASAWFSRRYLPAPAGLATMSAIAILATSFSIRAGVAAEEEIAKLREEAREQALSEALNPTADYPGSQVLLGDADPAPEPIRPDADVRALDYPWQYAQHKESPCIQRQEGTEVLRCVLDEQATGPLVVLAGASHTGQWGDVFAELARLYGWRLEVIERSGCLLSTAELGTEMVRDPQCEEWNKEALAALIDMKPDLVITQATTRRSFSDRVEAAHPGNLEAITKLNEAGIPTFLMRETTTLEKSMNSCGDGDDEQLRACSEPRSDVYEPSFDGADATVLGLDPELADVFDSATGLCDEVRCYAAIGNVRVHRDNDHLTATLTRTMLPQIHEQLKAFQPGLFTEPLAEQP
ncbi:MAG: acyltransferase family protein [Flaviflexus sp.]|nr:acyltransferase family protein [Flaviflexus sp.]